MRYEAAAVVPCPPPHRMPYSAALVIIIILVSIQMSREGASGQEMTKLVGPAGWMATLPHHAGADRCQSGAQSDTAPPWCGAVRFKNKEICLSVPSDVPVPLHEDCCIKTQKKLIQSPLMRSARIGWHRGRAETCTPVGHTTPQRRAGAVLQRTQLTTSNLIRRAATFLIVTNSTRARSTQKL